MSSKISKLLATAAFGLSAALLSMPGAAQAQAGGAQAYPSRAIRFVVPYPAGGGTDTMARVIGTRLNEAWGQPVVVENRAGAAGMIGNDLVAKAPADGYTVLFGITVMIQAPSLYPSIPYDVFRDFAPVTQIALSADLFVVPADSPARTLKDFVAMAKANPKKFNYGSYGAGTSSHIHGEMLNGQAGLDLAHVAYKGAAPLMTDVLGGQISSAFVDVTSARPHLKSGKFRVLAITGGQRYKQLPDLPTFTELGYKGYEPYGWFGVFVPAGTPKEIVDKLSTEIARIIRTPEVSNRLTEMGLQPVGNTAQEFAAIMKTDAEVWAKVIKAGNIKLD